MKNMINYQFLTDEIIIPLETIKYSFTQEEYERLDGEDHINWKIRIWLPEDFGYEEDETLICSKYYRTCYLRVDLAYDFVDWSRCEYNAKTKKLKPHIIFKNAFWSHFEKLITSEIVCNPTCNQKQVLKNNMYHFRRDLLNNIGDFLENGNVDVEFFKRIIYKNKKDIEKFYDGINLRSLIKKYNLKI